ncbi:unnamed protein product [Durusdinium trenchii]|uniref:Uncharacterized protein n=1 Tax=Durusdinium trenchii TaxID=1381693 RepID=A0ABP0K8N1_9DINO
MAARVLMGQVALMLVAALMVVASSSAFLLPGGLSGGPRLAARAEGAAEATTASPRSAEEHQFSFSGSSLLFLTAAGAIARNVGMHAASPKGKRAHWRSHRDKVRWYRRGELQAKRALKLGRGIKMGTIDFIYGKPQDEEDDEDYDDEYDDDDDELEEKSIG